MQLFQVGKHETPSLYLGHLAILAILPWKSNNFSHWSDMFGSQFGPTVTNSSWSNPVDQEAVPFCTRWGSQDTSRTHWIHVALQGTHEVWHFLGGDDHKHWGLVVSNTMIVNYYNIHGDVCKCNVMRLLNFGPIIHLKFIFPYGSIFWHLQRFVLCFFSPSNRGGLDLLWPRLTTPRDGGDIVSSGRSLPPPPLLLLLLEKVRWEQVGFRSRRVNRLFPNVLLCIPSAWYWFG
jgi:hypothetical protein